MVDLGVNFVCVVGFSCQKVLRPWLPVSILFVGSGFRGQSCLFVVAFGVNKVSEKKEMVLGENIC